MKTHSFSLKTTVLAAATFLTLALSVAGPATAASNVTCAKGQTVKNNTCVCPAGQQAISVPVDSGGSGCVPINDRTTDLTQNPIFFYLRWFLIFLGGGVGLAVVGGIVAGSYMYITARGNASQTQKGQMTILNSVIGLILFIFMYAILQFLIPGGVFG
jgi:hypothetical protein